MEHSHLYFFFVEIYLGSRINEIFSIPSALDFLRNYVSKNIPVVIRNSELNETNAVKSWSSNYLRYAQERDSII